MKQLVLKPDIYSYNDVKSFVEEFQIGKGDLVITNEFIYIPYFGELNLPCEVVYQEKFGTGEPSDDMVESMYKTISNDFRRVIAIGGGSVIDISKLFVLKDMLPILDLYDNKKPLIKEKELVIVPTTCGTGSEVTNISILALNSRNTKKGLASDEMYADSAVLIPELLTGLPFRFFATSSIDALIHAIESTLSPRGNPMTRLFGYKAIGMILNGYMQIIEKGQEHRKKILDEFLLASIYAGIAFGNAGCAAVHALSYPLGATHHVAHGEANYAIFSGVMRKYREKNTGGEMAVLNSFMAEILKCSVESVDEKLEEVLSSIITKKSLSEYGVKKEQLQEFTDSVLENQGRLLANNFIPLNREDIYEIYKSLY